MGRLWTLNSSLRLWSMPWMTGGEESFPSKIFSFLAIQIFHMVNETWARVSFLFRESLVESYNWVHHNQKREVAKFQSVRAIPANLPTSMECGHEMKQWYMDSNSFRHQGHLSSTAETLYLKRCLTRTPLCINFHTNTFSSSLK